MVLTGVEGGVRVFVIKLCSWRCIVSLRDRAMEARQGVDLSERKAKEEALERYALVVKETFCGVFGVEEDQVGYRCVSPSKAVLYVEDMEFVGETIPEYLLGRYDPGVGVKFKLRSRCGACGELLRSREVRNVEELGAALARSGSRHVCKEGKGVKGKGGGKGSEEDSKGK